MNWLMQLVTASIREMVESWNFRRSEKKGTATYCASKPITPSTVMYLLKV